MSALALALAAALLLYGHAVGLGVTLVALGLFAVAARRWSTWWALAGALALVPAVRAAGWVQWMALGGAFVFAALAAGGFGTVREAVGTAARALAGLWPGPFRVLAPIARRADGHWREAVPAARGVALATALLIPFATLFATADAAFAEWLDSAGEALPGFDESLFGRGLIALAVLAVAGALMLTPGKPASPGRPVIGRTEWVIALAALNALFAAFVALQLSVMFGGHEYVLRTAGLTYSEYAREGFWQLVAVAALTLAVIAATRRWTAGERLQRLLLGGLCVLTVIVLVSAWQRLGLYVEAFGLTRLRVLAEWGILVLGGLFLTLLALHRARRLDEVLVAFCGVALLAFALSDPERRIAEETTPEVRRTLSEDAGACVRDRSLVSLNLARLRAQPCAATS